MTTTLTVGARLSALLFILFFYSTAFAGAAKVDVCHIPPDSPEDFHTIRINEKALPAHLAHGDFAGACNEDCATLCDDGNACTVDDVLDCEEQGCPAFPREPVDCSDGLACTDDICDVVDGCSNPPECVPSDLCHVPICSEPDGECAETPKVCGVGEACDLGTGDCVPEAVCPCWTANDLLSVTADNIEIMNSCSSAEIPLVQNTVGSTPGVEGGFAVPGQSCLTRDFVIMIPTTVEETAVCVQQIADRCAEINNPIDPDSGLMASPTAESDIDPESVFD